MNGPAFLSNGAVKRVIGLNGLETPCRRFSADKQGLSAAHRNRPRKMRATEVLEQDDFVSATKLVGRPPITLDGVAHLQGMLICVGLSAACTEGSGEALPGRWLRHCFDEWIGAR